MAVPQPPDMVGYSIAAAQVIDALRGMREAPGHVFVPDFTSITDPVIDMGPLAGTKQVTDFHLLNLAARNSLRLATFDGSLLRAAAAADRGQLFIIDG